MEDFRSDTLNLASYPGLGSNVAMPHSQAPVWKAVHSVNPKVEPNEVNSLLYSNVGVRDVLRMVTNGLGISCTAV